MKVMISLVPDIADGVVTQRLAQAGAKFFIGHQAENVRGASVVVVSKCDP